MQLFDYKSNIIKSLEILDFIQILFCIPIDCKSSDLVLKLSQIDINLFSSKCFLIRDTTMLYK